jgi:hypothetical protein
MPRKVTRSHHPRIINMLFVSAGIAFLLAILVFILPFHRKVEEVAIQAQGDVARHAAQSIQLSVSTLLEREWESLVGFSAYVDLDDQKGTRVLADAAAMASEALTWAAFVDLDGTVLASTLGREQGADVSTATWFNQGLRRDTVLTDFGGGAGEETVIYMSRPARNAFGEVTGLAVYRLQGAWLDRFIQQAAERLDVDVRVLDENTQTLFEHGKRVGSDLSPLIRSRAELGTRFESIVTDQKGASSVSGVLPDLVEGGMPRFGWSLVVQVPAATGATAMGFAIGSLVWTVAGLFAAIGILAMVFAYRYLKPLTNLATEAAQIANGESVYPSEATRTYEAAQLSSALVRLQVNMKRQADV